MSSTASTLSWCTSFQTFTAATNESHKCLDTTRVIVPIVAQKKVKKVRKIILTEDMPELGKKGELLDVRAGFYRNFLQPMGKAQIVTASLLKEMKMEDERIEAEKKRVKEEAQQLARIFETVGAFKVKRKGGKGKQIFGSVTAQDVVDIIKAQLQSVTYSSLLADESRLREIAQLQCGRLLLDNGCGQKDCFPP